MTRPVRTSGRQASPPRPPATPVAYRSLPDQIASHIREAIALGRIVPGARLMEPALAREMGTSRAPVREALSRLEREGLVVKEPNRGARVVELTEETAREVSSLRGLLEGFAASLAAERLTQGQLATLDALLAEMEQAARQADYARLVELDYQFHAFICRASGHRTLYETWSAISGKVRLYLSTTNLMYRSLKAAVRGHREILEVLRSRDRARANRIMQEHLGEVLHVYVARITRRAPGGSAEKSATLREARSARRLAVRRFGRSPERPDRSAGAAPPRPAPRSGRGGGRGSG